MLRRLINMVILSTIVLGVAVLALFGPRPFDRYLPEAFGQVVEGIVGPGGLLQRDLILRAGDVPGDFLQDGPEGLVVTGPVAAGPGNLPVFIQDAVTGRTTRTEAAVPAEITTIRPILGCRLTVPQSGSVVGHASARQSDLLLPMLSYGDDDLAIALEDFVETYRRRGSATAREVPGIAYSAYDVVVTETGAPVYLVLVAGPGNWIWNIHLARGARVERVVLLGGTQAGVANLDPVVPVEVMLDEGLADCGIAPAYPLNAGHLWNRPQDQGGPADGPTLLRAQGERVAAFDLWFRDTFGVTASDSRVGFDRGAVSVIGPVPQTAEARAPFASIEGSRIRMTEGQYFELRGQVAPGADFVSRVVALATDFAFGDLNNLRQGVEF